MGLQQRKAAGIFDSSCFALVPSASTFACDWETYLLLGV
jgi:hypothetical protein